ncbi:Predicted transmembrane transcriptional regulator (anti-sigma factor) [Dermatophilus congolensis]|uniref:Predicted transmembrane transcriptional regulator (Anti-sigma factor) n=1 Tax=Dermatophilus congolensis TaxID=1863 RepID=A0AA46BNF9_9MICO|nr:mycothiol system anti-sigma-R factor [Dermatophilus congolensis]STD10108.1 Predicted transmembrane transcriptional regulator (anti-sigma factor) [Dermatophilus congolensis]
MNADGHSPGGCEEFYAALTAYLDGELTAADCEAIKAHLASCRSCAQNYERDLVLKSLIRRSCHCEEAPESLRVQILTRISMKTFEL